MKKSIECSIVRDLLPSFIDHVTSSESNEIIQAVTNNFYLQQINILRSWSYAVKG